MKDLWYDWVYYLRVARWDDYLITGIVAAILLTPLVRFLLLFISAQDLASYAMLATCCYFSRGLLSPRRNK